MSFTPCVRSFLSGMAMWPPNSTRSQKAIVVAVKQIGMFPPHAGDASMTRGSKGAHWHRLSKLVGYISTAWCKIWHRNTYKQMQSTTHFVYWWCRTCHRRWTMKK
jgi:hypothetical protein